VTTDSSDARAAFADFLLRLAERRVSVEDWNAFMVKRSPDAVIERARTTLTQKAMALQQCAGCVVPPGLDAVARELREELLH
jgi:hypothetical protein